MKDYKVRAELDRLKLRLFGHGCTDCLNVSTNRNSDALMSEYRGRIYELETKLEDIIRQFNEALDKKANKKPAKKSRK